MATKPKVLNRVDVVFEYTTFNSRSEFTLRNGLLVLEGGCVADDMKVREAEVKQLCVNFVLSKKPKWNIFMLDIKSITDAKPKSSKTIPI
jgi:hypothetical protein